VKHLSCSCSRENPTKRKEANEEMTLNEEKSNKTTTFLMSYEYFDVAIKLNDDLL
jgi:hypothetical protein